MTVTGAGTAGREEKTVTTTSAMKVSWSDVQPNRRRGGDVRIMLSPKTVKSTTGFGGMLTLEPGEFVCEHIHPYSEESIYVVSGQITMRIDTEYVDLGPGEACLVPINVKHRVENRGQEPAQVIFHLCPLAPRPELGHIDTEFLPGRENEPAPQVGGHL
ncbi:cupin [Micromonospora sagamiensis]|uniref:Putative monooxygenase n=2 Tax=Micromonospora sagamiensis TaxID=47875 RepID=A0A562WIT3_9ACTN|nr:putative monooxygenase [Micromonospora sagamiensis]BCL16761.1 cupin [Micromonospora sagamiensis]